jgi:hypothetical protein
MVDSDEDWRARSDMRTLCEAEEIKRDKGRHEAAKKKATEEMAKVAAVAKSEPKDQSNKPAKSGMGGKESMDRFVARREGKK